MEAQCAPDHIDIAPAGVAMAVFLNVATVIVAAPQLHKLWSLRSSDGVQPLTLCMVLTYSSANVVSALATKWRQMVRCTSSVDYCVVEQLDTSQICFGALVWVAVLTSVVLLPPHNTIRWRALVAATFLLITCMLAAAIAASVAEPCGPAALEIARGAAWLSASVAVVAFVPQLRATWRMRSAGSLSLVFTLIQAGGCMLVAATQILSAHDPWPVWLPTIVCGCMQFTVFSLAFYFRGCRDECARPEGTDALAAGDSCGSTNAEPFLSTTASAAPLEPPRAGSRARTRTVPSWV